MSFDTLQFAIFFPIVLGLYLLVEAHLTTRNLLLLLASYLFYTSWDWRFLSLLLAATGINYVAARLLDRRSAAAASYAYSTVVRKIILAAALILTLGQLFVFKYTAFFVDSLNPWSKSFPTVEILLPVGISFFTFQAIGYTLDVYHGQSRAETSLLKFATFVAFFPQLVAGPIVRAKQFLPQLSARRPFNLFQFYDGSLLIFWGLFKKFFVANNLARIVDPVFAGGEPLTGGVALAAIYAFAIQIYADFSGYTDIALGCALCMGFVLPPNFNRPYFAPTIREFWNRWHISLTTWFRDYLFYPLSRYLLRRTPRQAAGWVQDTSLLVTMTLIGLWHGAAWTFVFWGFYHGLLLAIYRHISRLWRRFPSGSTVLWWRGVGNVLLVFHLVCFGWLIFRAENLAQIGHFLQAIWQTPTTGLPAAIWPVLLYGGPLLIIQGLQQRANTWNVFGRWRPLPRGLVYASLFYLLLLYGDFGGEEFIYFQF
ncbi:MAG: MBOAT family protein [Anaerolineae bacterium]